MTLNRPNLPADDNRLPTNNAVAEYLMTSSPRYLCLGSWPAKDWRCWGGRLALRMATPQGPLTGSVCGNSCSAPTGVGLLLAADWSDPDVVVSHLAGFLSPCPKNIPRLLFPSRTTGVGRELDTHRCGQFSICPGYPCTSPTPPCAVGAAHVMDRPNRTVSWLDGQTLS
jgi:hypothetical protein